MSVSAGQLVSDLEWGTHLCYFYRDPQSLLDVQVPFFVAGLQHNESCVWIFTAPLSYERAFRALARSVPDLPELIRTGRMEILDGQERYGGGAGFDADASALFWADHEAKVLRVGRSGLRISGNVSGELSPAAWDALMDYEAKTDSIIHGRRIKSLCCYSVDTLTPDRIVDVATGHQRSIVRRADRWEAIENREYVRADLRRGRVDRLLRAAAANLPVGLTIYGPHRRIQFMNDVALAWRGLGLEQVLGRTEEELGSAGFAGETLDALTRACETLGPQSLECRRRDAADPPAFLRRTFTPLLDGNGRLERVIAVAEDISDRKRAEAQAGQLRSIEWMLSKPSEPKPGWIADGELSRLNTRRLLMDSVGKEILQDIVDEVLCLLDTSVAVFEANGDYAMDLASSSWCRLLDQASRTLCRTEDTRAALACGRWHCHESCWTDAAAKTIESGQPVDIPCRGGLRLLAVPIRAGGEVVGCISQGYGSPPREPERIAEIARQYEVDPGLLRQAAEEYEERPAYVIELAKHRLRTAARLIGEIVERHRTEAALRESEERFRLLYERAPQGYQSLDDDGHLIDVNDAWLESLGYSREEVIGRWFGDFLAPHQVQAFRERFPRFKEAGKTTVEFEMRRKDGTFATMFIVGRIGYDTHGRFKQTHCILNDVTERKRLEDERLALQQRLLHAQKLESLGVLAGGIAHDFNNLLQAIMGNLELAVQDLSPSSSARAGVEQSIRAAHRAVDLTRQMLAYSGKGTFVLAPLNLSEMVEENVRMLKAALPKSVSIELALARDLPALRADAGQVQQVIMNLITNAAEAMNDRPGTVRAATGVQECGRELLEASRLDEKPPPGRYVWLEVRDEGCGMDAETRQKLFDPFFTTKFAGRGLGMPVVLGIVRGHHGALLLDSERGRGTTIRVLLPVQAEAAVTAESPRCGTAPQAPACRGTVLVVEDEEMIRTLCESALKRAGYRTLLAVDGQEGVDRLREHLDTVDVVLLDLTMPRMDGLSAFREMRRIRPDVKIILCSGFTEQDATRSFDGQALAGFIQKPYDLTTLRNELARVLGAVE